MKPIDEKLEKCRVRRGRLKTDANCGNNGLFVVACPATRRRLNVLISNGGGWEHVSVGINHRPRDTPTWEEMCFIKDLFWQAGECVVQYHPPGIDYVNIHPGILHLWRPINQVIPMPPTEFV